VAPPSPPLAEPAHAAAPRSTQQARSARTRSGILGAAERLFAQRGYQATRLEEIAEQVGIRRASLFYYFKDKRALYDAVLENVLRGGQSG